jgi:hypothetical protein
VAATTTSGTMKGASTSAVRTPRKRGTLCRARAADKPNTNLMATDSTTNWTVSQNVRWKIGSSSWVV